MTQTERAEAKLDFLAKYGGGERYSIKQAASRFSEVLGGISVTDGQATQILAGEVLRIGGRVICMDDALSITVSN